MDKLPHDIIYEVFNHLDIDSFFATRHTCKRIYATTNVRLTSLVTAAAENTFPDQTRILARKPDQKADLVWLNELRYQQLAAILLECIQWRSPPTPEAYYLDDECPEGDYLRRKLALGFRVVTEFARMAREVYAVPIASLKQRPGSPQVPVSGPDINCSGRMKREMVLFDRCEDYISQMCAEDLQCIKFVLDGLRTAHTFSHKSLSSHQPGWDDTNKSEDWAVWKLIKIGPKALWNIWWTDRDAARPEFNASRTLLQNSSEHTCYGVKSTEHYVFLRVLDRLKNSERRRVIKSVVGASCEGDPARFSVHSPNARLFEPLTNRIRPLYMMRSFWESHETLVRDVLLHCIPIRQTIVWRGCDVVDEADVDPVSAPMFPYEERSMHRGSVNYARDSFTNAILFQDMEQKWLDWERDFGRKSLDRDARFARARRKVAEMNPDDLKPLADERCESRPGVWSRLKGALKFRSKRRSFIDWGDDND